MEKNNNTMEELQLKHLAPYSNFEVKCALQGIKSHWVVMTGFNFYDENEIWIYFDGDKGFLIQDVFPLLRPLSDLTQEIEHNGEKFLPFEKLMEDEHFWCQAYVEWWDTQEPNYETMMLSCPYEIMCLLLEWHFDVFGLIDKGLAIDLNTVK